MAGRLSFDLLDHGVGLGADCCRTLTTTAAPADASSSAMARPMLRPGAGDDGHAAGEFLISHFSILSSSFPGHAVSAFTRVFERYGRDTRSPEPNPVAVYDSGCRRYAPSRNDGGSYPLSADKSIRPPNTFDASFSAICARARIIAAVARVEQEFVLDVLAASAARARRRACAAGAPRSRCRRASVARMWPVKLSG